MFLNISINSYENREYEGSITAWRAHRLGLYDKAGTWLGMGLGQNPPTDKTPSGHNPTLAKEKTLRQKSPSGQKTKQKKNSLTSAPTWSLW